MNPIVDGPEVKIRIFLHKKSVRIGMIRAGVRTDSKIGGANFECGIGKQNRNDP